jgi:polar amino acid transport system permease protein
MGRRRNLAIAQDPLGVSFTLMNFDWSIIVNNLPLWLTGFYFSCALSIISCIVGSVLAIVLAIFWRVGTKQVRYGILFFVEIFKSLPLLVLLVAIQYVIPVLWSGWTLSAFWNSCIALALSLAAFMAEVLRSGIDAIPKGHLEAAEALGISKANIIRRILIPETIRRTFAAIIVLFISVLKFSTLASILGVPELLFNARMININTVRPVEVYTGLTLAFLILVSPLSFFARWAEKHKWINLTPTSQLS